MKKLFKNSILILAVLLFGVGSCNSDDIPIIDTSDYKTLSLRISMAIPVLISFNKDLSVDISVPNWEENIVRPEY